jgi:uncharacterized protein YjiS (DUF1127 family)
MNTTVQSMPLATTSERVVQGVAQRLHAVIERVRLARRRSRLLRELQDLDDHMLHDIGVHRAELSSVVAEVIGAAAATRRHIAGLHP